MPSCCRICNHRSNDAMVHTTPQALEVGLITLSFKTALWNASSPSCSSLNAVLNNITDAVESTSHPSSFTSWSPCLLDAKKAVILTTASETCRSAPSSIFEPAFEYLSTPPSVEHIYLDYAALSLAASSSEEKVPIDIITVRAPNPGVASAIGKRFGWDPKRSSLSAQMEIGASAGFSRPGDLTRDFWTWAELRPGAPTSPSTSVGSGYESGADTRPGLISTNSDEKNMSLFYAEDEERRNMEDETLVMIFQWSSHADADRFKHPLQKSYGQNGAEVSGDMWDRHVAHPVRQLQGIGAKTKKLKLELRSVEPRMDSSKGAARERSGSRRLSVMASGLGGKMSGLWSR